MTEVAISRLEIILNSITLYSFINKTLFNEVKMTECTFNARLYKENNIKSLTKMCKNLRIRLWVSMWRTFPDSGSMTGSR